MVVTVAVVVMVVVGDVSVTVTVEAGGGGEVTVTVIVWSEAGWVVVTVSGGAVVVTGGVVVVTVTVVPTVGVAGSVEVDVVDAGGAVAVCAGRGVVVGPLGSCTEEVSRAVVERVDEIASPEPLPPQDATAKPNTVTRVPLKAQTTLRLHCPDPLIVASRSGDLSPSHSA